MPQEAPPLETIFVSNTYCNCPRFGGSSVHKEGCIYHPNFGKIPKPSPYASRREWKKWRTTLRVTKQEGDKSEDT